MRSPRYRLWSLPTGLMIRVLPWKSPAGQSGGAARSLDPLHDRCQLPRVLTSSSRMVIWLQMSRDRPPRFRTSESRCTTPVVANRPTRCCVPHSPSHRHGCHLQHSPSSWVQVSRSGVAEGDGVGCLPYRRATTTGRSASPDTALPLNDGNLGTSPNPATRRASSSSSSE